MVHIYVIFFLKALTRSFLRVNVGGVLAWLIPRKRGLSRTLAFDAVEHDMAYMTMTFLMASFEVSWLG